MIARFRVALAFPLTLSSAEKLRSYNVSWAGHEFVVQPPYQSELQTELLSQSVAPITELVEKLRPAAVIGQSPNETIAGAPALHANALQIEVHRESFDRRRALADADRDPPASLFFEVANSLLRRLRSVTQSGLIRPLLEKQCFWRIDYLKDDGVDLEIDTTMIRRRLGGHFSWKAVAVTRHVWERAASLPSEFDPTVWEILYQDAITLLPERGPALVMTAAALETMIAHALNVLAAGVTMPDKLWEWINDRDDYRKEPSVEERYDDLLRIVAGKSLKDEKDLWITFKNIKNARNSFVHGGRPTIGNREVTVEETYDLVAKAANVVQWIEALLPETHRRPIATEPADLQMNRLLVAPLLPQLPDV
ncbi:MAG: hypothetical protein EPO40_18255 [Myxococcaceae bacterium]|nr:MAG: hypothetical protein EPO40_18255 [Myxococcaceae bacterium]